MRIEGESARDHRKKSLGTTSSDPFHKSTQQTNRPSTHLRQKLQHVAIRFPYLQVVRVTIPGPESNMEPLLRWATISSAPGKKIRLLSWSHNSLRIVYLYDYIIFNCVSLYVYIYVYIMLYLCLSVSPNSKSALSVSKLPRYFTSGYAWTSSSLHLALPVPTQSTSATRTLSSSLYSWMHIRGRCGK